MPTTTDGLVSAIFASKHPHTTCWLTLEAPADADLSGLLADLAAAGWGDVRRDTPAFPAVDEEGTPLGYDAVEIDVCAPGTGLFTGWTDEEAARLLPAAREILAGYGFADVPVWQMDWRDLI